MKSCTTNLLTIDLEEWFVVEALSAHLDFDQWRSQPSTLVANSQRLLDILARHNVCATWFVLGWCADQHPNLIAEILARGHEVACHSYRHRKIDTLDREGFYADTQQAQEAITRACGYRPIGYRAPSWSLNDSVSWAFELLAEMGFMYDSSIFPIKHDIYGSPEAPRKLFKMTFANGNNLIEMPASTVRLFGKNLPVAGGGYLRHAPLWYSKRMIHKLNRQGLPAVVYMHPWEIDPSPPVIKGMSRLQRFRTQGSTSLMAYKLDQLLTEFRFTTMHDYIKQADARVIGFEHRQ